MSASTEAPGARRPAPGGTTEPIARLERASKRYGRVLALDDVTLDLGGGRITALLGPNGAGKTTAVRLLLGLATPTSGTARVLGEDPRRAATRAHVGAMLQVATVPATLRVAEHVELFRSYYPRPLSFEAVTDAAGLRGIERKMFGDLSGGQKQRLLFALALCGDPELLVLDEPTVGMDVEARRLLWGGIRRLRAEGRAVLLTTHYLDEADALADRVVVLAAGRVVADGSPAEVKARVPGRRIRCETSLAADELQAIPGVAAVRRDGDATEVLASGAEDVLREMLARDPSLSRLEVGGAGLEDAFLAVVAGGAAAGGSR